MDEHRYRPRRTHHSNRRGRHRPHTKQVQKEDQHASRTKYIIRSRGILHSYFAEAFLDHQLLVDCVEWLFSLHNTFLPLLFIITHRAPVHSLPVPSPSGFSIPMAPGSNLSGAYEASSSATTTSNLKLIIPGPPTGPSTRPTSESPDVRQNCFLIGLFFIVIDIC